MAILPAAATCSLRSMNWCVIIELLVWLLIFCVLIELLCGYWTNKNKNHHHRFYHQDHHHHHHHCFYYDKIIELTQQDGKKFACEKPERAITCVFCRTLISPDETLRCKTTAKNLVRSNLLNVGSKRSRSVLKLIKSINKIYEEK